MTSGNYRNAVGFARGSDRNVKGKPLRRTIQQIPKRVPVPRESAIRPLIEDLGSPKKEIGTEQARDMLNYGAKSADICYRFPIKMPVPSGFEHRELPAPEGGQNHTLQETGLVQVQQGKRPGIAILLEEFDRQARRVCFLRHHRD